MQAAYINKIVKGLKIRDHINFFRRNKISLCEKLLPTSLDRTSSLAQLSCDNSSLSSLFKALMHSEVMTKGGKTNVKTRMAVMASKK